MTQAQVIERYMQMNGSITSIQAIGLGITRLAARIADLERKGILVNHQKVSVQGRFGKTNVTRYSLVKIQDGQTVLAI